MTEWGGGDGRPAQKKCPECGKMVRGLKAHREDAHRRPARLAKVRADKVAEAIMRELSRQHDASEGGLIFHVADDRSRVGIDGFVNLRDLGRAVIEATEAK